MNTETTSSDFECIMTDDHKTLLAFLSGNTNIVDLQHRVMTDASLEAYLDTAATPYCETEGTLVNLILETNPHLPQDINTTHAALNSFAIAQGLQIPATNPAHIAIEASLQSAIPSWIIPPSDYLTDLVNAIGPLPTAAFMEEIRRSLLADFRCAGQSPRWLHKCSWPMSEGQPSKFLGQIDSGEGAHDDCQIYIFWHESSDRYEVIRQRAER